MRRIVRNSLIAAAWKSGDAIDVAADQAFAAEDFCGQGARPEHSPDLFDVLVVDENIDVLTWLEQRQVVEPSQHHIAAAGRVEIPEKIPGRSPTFEKAARRASGGLPHRNFLSVR